MTFILILLQLLCAAACIHYAVTSRFAPMRAAYNPSRRMPWWAWIYFMLLFFGYGGMLYAAGRWITQDLPDFFQQAVGGIALFGSFFVIDAFGELGRLTLREQEARSKL